MGRGFDELKLEGLTLRGITRGGIETCLMVPELGIMFDVGMCPPGVLKFDDILVSHGHADHLGGLFYLLSQRSLMGRGAPNVYVPQELVEPLQTICAQWSRIEDFELPARFLACRPKEAFSLGRGLDVMPLRTVHRVPALAYLVSRTTQRLRAEFVGRPGPEARGVATGWYSADHAANDSGPVRDRGYADRILPATRGGSSLPGPRARSDVMGCPA